MQWAGVPSSMGELGLGVDASGLRAVRFEGPPAPCAGAVEGVLADAVQQMTEYLDGVRREFTVPLAATGGSEFERAVWAQIASIGYGETRTYGSIATALGDP